MGPQGGDAQREWFPTRDRAPTFQAANMSCATYFSDLQTYVTEFSTAMGQVGENARRAGVYPGAIRRPEGGTVWIGAAGNRRPL